MLEEQLTDFLRLLDSPEAAAALAQLESGVPVLSVRKFVEGFAPRALCPMLLDALDCRVRYQGKFERAQSWFLVRAAAEQATPSRIARWRSALLGQTWGRHAELTEVGCGVGGDSVFLQSSFHLKAFEADPLRATLARVNLERLGAQLGLPPSPSPPTVLCEVADIETIQTRLLFVDPTRRDAARAKRLYRPEDWSPPLSALIQGLRRRRYSGLAVKANPGFEPEENDGTLAGAQLHFISIAGALKECLILLGEGVDALPSDQSSRTAWIGPASGADFQRVKGDDGPQSAPPVSTSPPAPGTFVHNPDPALVRARALGTLCRRWEASLVHPKIAYLMGPRPIDSALAQSFRIVESLALDWSLLIELLEKLGWTHVEILARGTPFTVEEARTRLRKALTKKRTSSRGGSLIFYRDTVGYRALLAERVTP